MDAFEAYDLKILCPVPQPVSALSWMMPRSLENRTVLACTMLRATLTKHTLSIPIICCWVTLRQYYRCHFALMFWSSLRRLLRTMQSEQYDAWQLCPVAPKMILDSKTSERKKNFSFCFNFPGRRIPLQSHEKGERCQFFSIIAVTWRGTWCFNNNNLVDQVALFSAPSCHDCFTHFEACHERSRRSYCLAKKSNPASRLMNKCCRWWIEIVFKKPVSCQHLHFAW